MGMGPMTSSADPPSIHVIFHLAALLVDAAQLPLRDQARANGRVDVREHVEEAVERTGAGQEA